MINASKEKMKIYEMVFSGPGMEDNCKVSTHVSRKNIIVLCRLLEIGMETNKEKADELVGTVSNESMEEVKKISSEFLNKSGLTCLYEKLKLL